jgi:hypothetical protein
LRYDRRGVGESPGDWRTAGLYDNVDDLGRARDALAARPEVDPQRILLAGHSEGAVLAACCACSGSTWRRRWPRTTTGSGPPPPTSPLSTSPGSAAPGSTPRWTREFMAHDPREDLRRIPVPVLALTGEKDLQVDPADLEVIAATVPGGATIHVVPELTHTLRGQPGPPSPGGL